MKIDGAEMVVWVSLYFFRDNALCDVSGLLPLVTSRGKDSRRAATAVDEFLSDGLEQRFTRSLLSGKMRYNKGDRIGL